MCCDKLGATRLRVSRQALVSRCDKRRSSTTTTHKCGGWVGTSLERFSARQETMGVSVSGKVDMFSDSYVLKFTFFACYPIDALCHTCSQLLGQLEKHCHSQRRHVTASRRRNFACADNFRSNGNSFRFESHWIKVHNDACCWQTPSPLALTHF